MTRPPDPVIAWLVAVHAPGARVATVGSLSQSGSGGPWQVDLTRDGSLHRTVVSVGDPTDPATTTRFRTEAAALDVAASHDVPAPRVLAVDLDGTATGHLALAMTRLAGTSRISATTDPARLGALGAAAARTHATDVAPSDDLPRRERSLSGADLGEVAGPSADLLAEAGTLLRTTTAPTEVSGLVHGDLWHGNTVWDGYRYSGAIDWDFAGVGPAGIDLGSLRCDAAVLFGGQAPGAVLAGWEAERGEAAPNVAWWDVVAGVATPADLRGWLPNFHAQGRGDLDLETITQRRDAFLAGALQTLR